MGESSWIVSSDPQSMLECLGERASSRKLRLFDAACCRRVWALLGKDCRKAVRAAERYADGLIGLGELRQARERAERSCQASWKWWTMASCRAVLANSAACRAGEEHQSSQAALLAAGVLAVLEIEPMTSARRVGVMSVAGAGLHLLWWRKYGKESKERERLRERRVTERSEDAWWGERKTQTDLLRCIFGNPFRPVTLDPDWLTPTVISLAQAAYDERILPSGELDLLRLSVLADALEESGASGDILDHLRAPGPHVRGCFAVDAILGKG